MTNCAISGEFKATSLFFKSINAINQKKNLKKKTSRIISTDAELALDKFNIKS